jgi:hypothetical protein
MNFSGRWSIEKDRTMRLFSRLAIGAALLLTLLSQLPGQACPFCGSMQGQTLVKEVQQARFVIYGTPSNPRPAQGPDGKDATDFTIDEIIKNDPFLKNKKMLTLPRYIPPTTNGPEKLIVFCDLVNDQADTYLYLAVPGQGAELVKYLKEAMKVDEKDIPKRLRFYFNYLDHTDNEIATDAFKEFSKADYPDVMKMVKQFGDESMHKRLQAWLKDPNTAVYRFGLIGMMLGLCGNKDDSQLFQSVLDDPDKNLVSGVDGILAGYILVDKEQGWAYTKKLISASDKDFSKRYAGLRTVRFLWDTHMGHVPEKDLLAALATLLEQGDIVDLAIEDLRKWKQWQFTDQILAVSKKPTHAAPIVQRAVLRYMLSCPQDKSPAAKEYVELVKQSNPEKVKDALELLELEKSMQPTPAEVSKKP